MSSRFWRHFITNGGRDLPETTPISLPPDDEGEAMDAYSRVVVRVAERLRPAVVNLRVGRGGGSGADRAAPSRAWR